MEALSRANGQAKNYSEPKKKLSLCLNAVAEFLKKLKMSNDLHIFG